MKRKQIILGWSTEGLCLRVMSKLNQVNKKWFEVVFVCKDSRWFVLTTHLEKWGISCLSKHKSWQFFLTNNLYFYSRIVSSRSTKNLIGSTVRLWWNLSTIYCSQTCTVTVNKTDYTLTLGLSYRTYTITLEMKSHILNGTVTAVRNQRWAWNKNPNPKKIFYCPCFFYC